MAFDVKVPAVGESVQEGMVHQWHVESGQYIEQDEVLVELETDKATVEIVAEVSGTVTIIKAEGESVNIGDVIATIDTDAKPTSKSAAAKEAPAEPAESSPAASAPAKKAAPQKDANINPAEDLSPGVRRMIAEKNLDASSIKGTGKGGRITKELSLIHI